MEGREGLYGREGLDWREAVGHWVGRPAGDEVKEGVARLAQHLELELDLYIYKRDLYIQEGESPRYVYV